MNPAENTPTTQRVLRQRHTPTPKMSERKKALFAATKQQQHQQHQLHQTPSHSAAITTIDEDSDLGPMSPLQFSCSPSSYTDPSSRFMQARSPARPTTGSGAPTDFRNIMQQLSPCRRASDQYEAVYSTTPTKRRTTAGQTAPLPELEKENCGAQLPPAAVQQTTPSVPTSRTADAVPRVSHRKSLIFDTGLTPTTVDAPTADTPKDGATFGGDQSAESSRARASLSFSADGQQPRQSLAATTTTTTATARPGISARSFYGSSYGTPTAAAAAESRKPPTPPSASSFRTIARRRSSMPAGLVGAAERRRSRNAQPRLSSGGISRGRPVCHRITKPKLPAAMSQSQAAGHSAAAAAAAAAAKSSAAARPHGRKFANRAEVIAAALALIESHATVTKRIQNNATAAERQQQQQQQQQAADDNQITQHQIEKLQRILSAQRSNAYALASKELNWLGGGGGRGDRSPPETSLCADVDNTFGHLSVLDSTALNETAAADATATTATETSETGPPQKRKFFKSDTANANKYTVMRGVCVSMKRGIGVQTLSPPQPPKRARHSHAEYAELRAINREVSDIIDMLETIGGDDDADDDADEPTAVVAAAASAEPVAPASSSTAPDGRLEPLVPDAAASRRHYEHFRRQLPYNTGDPETQQRQRTLLSMLDTHHICCERTFRIFIAEPLRHEREASQILDQLFQLDVVQTAAGAEVDGQLQLAAMELADGDEELQMEPLRDSEETESTASVPLSPASQISTLTSAMELGSPTTTTSTATEASTAPATEATTSATHADKVFPIFCRDRARPPDRAADRAGNALLIGAGAAATKAIAWRAYGRDARQLQIDAGQRSFGGTQCAGCGMFYARHEPEDEALHQRYHDLSGRLAFRGWQDERLVCEVPEWGAAGRIVCVQRDDAKAKRTRATEIVRLVDEALGVPPAEAETGDRLDWGAQSVIYLAIARRQVVGVCVAEPLHTAHPMRLQPGGVPMMELEQTRLVRCGLSRLWVIEAYRRHGIGRRLFDAVRGHFCRGGYVMGLDEVAFGSPTEAGCAFAARMVGDAANVLVY